MTKRFQLEFQNLIGNIWAYVYKKGSLLYTHIHMYKYINISSKI